jgi:hypothetical protein
MFSSFRRGIISYDSANANAVPRTIPPGSRGTKGIESATTMGITSGAVKPSRQAMPGRLFREHLIGDRGMVEGVAKVSDVSFNIHESSIRWESRLNGDYLFFRQSILFRVLRNRFRARPGRLGGPGVRSA